MALMRMIVMDTNITDTTIMGTITGTATIWG